jgi:hypothetical protein
MSFTLLASASQQSGNQNDVQTALISSGADLIVVIANNQFHTAENVLSDDQGNTWTPLTAQESSSGAQQRTKIYYCVSPNVAVAHVFSLGFVAGSFPSISVLVFSGAKVSDAFEGESGANGNSGTMQPGAITPSLTNTLFVVGANHAGTDMTIDGSFSEVADMVGSINATAMFSAYKLSSAVAENPTVSAGGGGNVRAVVMAAFNAADGVALVGGAIPFRTVIGARRH